jgi:hypothetical protein
VHVCGGGLPLGPEPRRAGRRGRVCRGHAMRGDACGHPLLAPGASERGAGLQREGGRALAAGGGGSRHRPVLRGGRGGASACLPVVSAAGLGRDPGAERGRVGPPTRDALPGRRAGASRRARAHTLPGGGAPRCFLPQSCPREHVLTPLGLVQWSAWGDGAMRRRRETGTRDGPRCSAPISRLVPP